jgi:hypothetical protein
MMAAYICLNCEEIMHSDEDCCNKPDPFCMNDMPGEIKHLRQALEAAGGLSWNDFNVRGDAASIREVRRLVEFEAARKCTYLTRTKT